MDDEKLNTLVDDFHLINHMFHRTFFHHGKHCGGRNMPVSNYRVLGILKKRGAIPMSVIGKKGYISRPNMTALIDKLVDEGLVERSPDENDRRVINIILTGKGEEELLNWRKNENIKIRNKLSVLSDKNLETLYESIRDIKAILNKMENE